MLTLQASVHRNDISQWAHCLDLLTTGETLFSKKDKNVTNLIFHSVIARQRATILSKNVQ